MIPVPDYPGIDTPYGRRGSYWSCDEDANGNGIHTGADFAAPQGVTVVAARPGKLVHCDHGSSFGYNQVEIQCSDGTRDFYAHMSMRVNQQTVNGGQKIGEVGSQGNVTGPHLHFERHSVSTGPWSCSIVRDPAPSINWQPEEDDDEMKPEDWDKLRDIVADEVQKNNKAATDAVWDEKQKVTLPDGKDGEKSMRQIQRETWQTVKKL